MCGSLPLIFYVIPILSRPSSANSINSSSSSNHSAFVPEPTVTPAAGDLASRLSSDEGEVEGVEETEKLDCYYSGHHPKPLAVCSLFLYSIRNPQDERWFTTFYSVNFPSQLLLFNFYKCHRITLSLSFIQISHRISNIIQYMGLSMPLMFLLQHAIPSLNPTFPRFMSYSGH